MLANRDRDRGTSRWPHEQGQWRQLAEQSAHALRALMVDGEVRRMASDSLSPPIAPMRALEALIEMLDLAGEWARPFTFIGALNDAVLAGDPAEALLAAHEERDLADYADAIEAAFDELKDRLPDALSDDRFRPLAVAALTAARARAVLRRVGEAAQEGVAADPDTKLSALVGELVRQAVRLCALPDNKVHPFVVYRVVKALWLAELCTNGDDVFELAVELKQRLKSTTRAATERLIAEHTLLDVTQTQSVALAFCAATLAVPEADDLGYVDAALSAAIAGQSRDGSWPEGRGVTWQNDPDTGEPLALSTHDVALAVAEALSLLGIPSATRGRPMPGPVAALQKALAYAATSSVRATVAGTATVVSGWAERQRFGEPEVTSAASAAVLQLAANARRVAEHHRQSEALGRFVDVWDPASDFTAPYLIWDKYRERNEPDAANPILGYLHTRFIEQASRRRREDPRPWRRTPAMSVILFGPPGTTKTTIVKSMAQGLGWPLVTLSPGTFVEDGLDGVERRTTEIFAWLRDLAQAVVLFDECDELFRARNQGVRGGETQPGDQARSITAFLTASMLPKLQDLRDRGQVFFVIATNYFDQIDSAVRRVGRIDSIVGVGWPDKPQRLNTIRKEFEDSLSRRQVTLDPALVDAAVDHLASATRYFVRGDLVGAAGALAERHAEITDVDKARSTADAVRQEREKSIRDPDLTAFRRDAAESSVTHVHNRGELMS